MGPLRPPRRHPPPEHPLTAAPEDALHQLCAFAGLPYDPALLQASGGQGRVDELLSQPIGRREDADTARIEYRVPDAACNPYLVFAAVVTKTRFAISGCGPITAFWSSAL